MSFTGTSVTTAKEMLVDAIRFNLDLDFEEASVDDLRNQIITPYLIGPPGCAKTSIARQAWREVCAMIESGEIVLKGSASKLLWTDFVPASRDPAVLAGLDVPEPGSAQLISKRPAWMPPADEPYVILFDEFSQCVVMQANVMAQAINERRMGDHYFHPNSTIIMTGNARNHRAGVQETPSHVKNRVFFIFVMPSMDDFVSYAAAQHYDPVIIGYLQASPTHLQATDIDFSAAYGYPSLRAWEQVNRIMKADIPNERKHSWVMARLGNEVGANFYSAFELVNQLPNFADIVKDPTGTPLPDNSSAYYQLSAMIAAYTTEDNIDQVFKYLYRFKREEFIAFCVRDIGIHTPNLRAHPLVTEHITSNKNSDI